MSRALAVRAPAPPSIDADAPREFVQFGEGAYGLVLDALGITFEVDRLRRERHELVGELTVRCDLAGARTFNGVLSVGDMNVSSIRARQDRGRYLRDRAQATDVDWVGLLEEFAQRVLTAERQGRPAVSLRDLPRPAPDQTFSVHGLTLLQRHPVGLFGDGGSGKSLISLFVAGELQRAGKRVGLFDWELAGEDHRERLEALYGPQMPDLKYLRCDRPMSHMADAIRRIVRQERLDYAVFDSVAFACDGPPEAAEVAGRYFQAVRQLGPIGSLHVAHVAKPREGDRGHEQKPFGSGFWHNGLRGTWFAKLAESDREQQSITIGLFNRKANLGRLQPPVGFRIAFAQGRTTFERTDLTQSPELATRLSVGSRIRAALKSTSLTREALEQELDGVAAETLKRTLNREIKAGRIVQFPGPSGEPRIGLCAPEGRS